jgi:enamine deaminase RidA (YjgF/YER057c/UK114 family)
VSLENVDPPQLYVGAPYHYATIASAGQLVFSAGACPIDVSGRVPHPGDLDAQAALAVRNLETALQAAGAGLGDVVKTTVYVAARDRSELVRAWDVVAAAFAPAKPPSTLLGVAFLGYPEQLVEIEAIAVAG